MIAPARRSAPLPILGLIVVLAALALTLGAPDAQTAAYRPCDLSERDREPPGGTSAYNLTVARARTSCAVATGVMKAFHRCRTEAGARCTRRVLRSWRCSGGQRTAEPQAMPAVRVGTFACRSGARRVKGGYRQNTPTCYGAAARDPKRPCVNLTTAVLPHGDGVEDHRLEAPAGGCDPGFAAPFCSFGVAPEAGALIFALFGDSHAYHWRAALARVAVAKRWTGYYNSSGGCYFNDEVGGFSEQCAQWYTDLHVWLREHPDVHTVFVTANADTPVPIEEGETYRSAKLAGYRRAFEALPPSVKHLIVLRDTPRSTQAVFDCMGIALNTPGARVGPACPAVRSEVLREDLGVAAVQQLRSPRYRFIDLSQFMCGSRYCYPVVAGARVNSDTFGHISVTFARSLAPYLQRALDKLALS